MKFLPTRKSSSESPETKPFDPDEVYDFNKAIKPSVNFIPQAVRDARGFAQTVRMSGFGLIALAGVLVIGFFAVGAGAITANSDAANAASAAAITQTKIKQLSTVQSYYDAITDRKNEVQTKFNGSIDYAAIYGTINDALPSGVTLDSVSTAIGTTCAGADPFSPTAAIGCATIQASAPDTATISTFTNALGADKSGILVDPYASDISDAGSGSNLSFKLTVNFTQKAYSTLFTSFGTTPTNTIPATTSPSTTSTSTGSNDTATGK